MVWYQVTENVGIFESWSSGRAAVLPREHCSII